jgi:hypothetical protein
MKTFKRLIIIFSILLAIVFSIGFVVLKHGINVSELSLSNAKISNAHLILDQIYCTTIGSLRN